jgi:phenylalanyl-tRNA synthetase beta chain
LLRALGRNISRSNRSAALFEVGTVFRLAKEGSETPVEERRKVGIALTGSASNGWWEGARPFDFFDAKGILESLLAGLGVGEWSLGSLSAAGDDPGLPFHPARSANISIGGTHAGVIGEIHPRIAEEQFDIPGRAAIVVLAVGSLLSAWNPGVGHEDSTRFPPSRRDLAFVLDAGAPAGAVRRAIEESAGDLAGQAVLFDVFEGSPIPQGKKSLAFSLDFRSPERTLTDEETDAAVKTIAERLAADFGAELRSG